MKAENKKFKLTGKTFLCVFLSLTLMACGVPFAFANDNSQSQVEKTSEAVADAAASAAVALDTVAAANEILAGGSLELAVGTIDVAQGAIDAAAGEAVEAAEDAANAATEAEEAAAKAAEAQEKAAEAAQRAQDQKVAIAEAQAALAKEAATEATKDAVDAYNAMLDAYTQAEAAKLAYQAAQKTYEDTCKQIEEQLNAGLILAKEAADLTKEAKEKADDLYQEMLEKQKAAEEAAKTALANKNKADQELSDEIDELAQIVLDQAENVATKTAVTAATGVALTAAKIAVEFAEKTVQDINDEIAVVDANISTLREKVAAAQAAIEEAEAAANEAEGEYNTENGLLEEAKAALETAKAALKNAENILNLEKKYTDENGEYYVTYSAAASAQNKIKNGTGTSNDVKTVTEYVLKNVGKYDGYVGEAKAKISTDGDITWVSDSFDENKNVFFITVKDSTTGKDKKVYYEAQIAGEEGSQYVQYVPVEQTPHYVTELEEIKTSVEAKDGNTFYIYLEDFAIDLIITKINVTAGWQKVEYNAQKGGYYTKILGQTLTVTKNVDGTFKAEIVKQVWKKKSVSSGSGPIKYDGVFDYGYDPNKVTAIMNSNAIDNIWASASGSLEERTKKVDEKQAVVDEYTKTVAEKKTAWDEAVENVGAAKQDKEDLEDEIAVQKENREALLKELNGGSIDTLIRAFVSEDSTLSDLVAKIIDNPAYLLKMNQSEENALSSLLEEVSISELLNELTNGNLGETYEKVTAIIGPLSDGQFTEDDIDAVVNAVKLFTDDEGISLGANTKLEIFKWIERLAQQKHNESLEALEKAIDEAEKAIEDQTKDVLTATENALKAEAELIVAEAKKAIVDSETALAESLKDKATQAAEDAEKAYQEYNTLVAMGLKPDDTSVKQAKQAWENAEKSAKAANEEWQEAKDSAIEAIKDAINALLEVDKAYNKPYAINVDGGTATVTYVPAHTSCILEFANSVKADTSDFFGLLGAEECASIGAIALMVQVDQLTNSASLEGCDTDDQDTTETEEAGLTAIFGSTVLLRANEAPEGKVFEKWIAEGVILEEDSCAVTTFSMPENNVTIKAVYKDKPSTAETYLGAIIPNTGDPVSLVPFAAAAAVAIALAGFALYSLRRRHE